MLHGLGPKSVISILEKVAFYLKKLRWIASLPPQETTSSLPQDYLKITSRLPQDYLKTTSRLPQVYLKTTSRLPQDYLKSTSSLPQVYLKTTSSLPPQDYFPKTTSSLPQVYLKTTSSLPQVYLKTTSSLPQEHKHLPCLGSSQSAQPTTLWTKPHLPKTPPGAAVHKSLAEFMAQSQAFLKGNCPEAFSLNHFLDKVFGGP